MDEYTWSYMQEIAEANKHYLAVAEELAKAQIPYGEYMASLGAARRMRDLRRNAARERYVEAMAA